MLLVFDIAHYSEQVAASTNKEVDAHIPNYPTLAPQLICQLHNVTMHVSVYLFPVISTSLAGSLLDYKTGVIAGGC